FVYFGIGTLTGLITFAVHPIPAVGASGAINGIVGMFVVWYLLNEITCWYVVGFFHLARTGTLGISSFWMILLWLIFDIWGAISGEGEIGYLAHIVGFVVGVGLGVLLLQLRLLEMDEGERSLLQVLLQERKSATGSRRRKRHR